MHLAHEMVLSGKVAFSTLKDQRQVHEHQNFQKGSSFQLVLSENRNRKNCFVYAPAEHAHVNIGAKQKEAHEIHFFKQLGSKVKYMMKQLLKN